MNNRGFMRLMAEPPESEDTGASLELPEDTTVQSISPGDATASLPAVGSDAFPPASDPDTSPDSKRRWTERLSACNGCDRCGDRCVAGISISRWEFQRIREFLRRQDPGEVHRIAAQEKRLPWPGAPALHYEACRFRDVENDRCGIYPVRPMVCRLFGHVEWLPCPAGIVPDASPRGIGILQWYHRRDLRAYEEWLALEESGPQADGRSESPPDNCSDAAEKPHASSD